MGYPIAIFAFENILEFIWYLPKSFALAEEQQLIKGCLLRRFPFGISIRDG